MNGVPMVGVVVIPQPGANHIEIANAVYDRMEKMKKDLPEDVHYNYGFDNTKFIRASIRRGEADGIRGLCTGYHHHFPLPARLACDAGAVHCDPRFAHRRFLRDVSGRFLHQCALHAGRGACRGPGGGRCHRDDREHLRPHRERDATQRSGYRGCQEIFFAVISTTITLVAVFFPIVFMDGTTGRLFREFSIVVSGSVIISSFAALTFTPMLATKLLVEGTAELVLSQDRTFLRRNEPGIQPVTGRLPETALDCPALHHRHHPAYRSPLEYYPG